MKHKIVRVGSYDQMSRIVAREIEHTVRTYNGANLGLPTGGTSIGMYKELRKLQNFSWENVRTFNLDEYVGIDSNHPESYKNFMNRNLFNHIQIPDSNINFPEDESYDKKISEYGGLDLTILGVGTNGHLAFNEPGSSFDSTTREVLLKEQTIKDNSRFFNSIEEVPTKAISMGLKTIMNSREIILIAQGSKKYDILQTALTGDITEEIPASILQNHPNVIVLYCE